MANKVYLKRGLEASRAGLTPAAGEPLWITDDKKLYVGDGSTAGGNIVGEGDVVGPAGATGNNLVAFSGTTGKIIKMSGYPMGLLADISTALQPGDVDDTPVNGATTDPVSSNWAYDHDADTSAHGGPYNNYTHPTTAGNKHIPSGGSTDQYLKYSASGTAVWATIDASGSTTMKFFEVITATGTWTLPTNIVEDAGGDSTIHVTAIAGGGGGGMSTLFDADGGNAGESCNRVPLTVSANVSAVVGGGGAGKTTSSANGGDGGTTSFGGISLVGGSGGEGASGTNDQKAGGAPGGHGIDYTSAESRNGNNGPGMYGGAGGNAQTDAGGGGGGIVIDASETAGVDGTTAGGAGGGKGYGAGGGASDATSGAGAAGAILVEWEETV